jgi:hypothetical protein
LKMPEGEWRKPMGPRRPEWFQPLRKLEAGQ